MVIVLGKLEDHMHYFLPGSVHKLRHVRRNSKKNSNSTVISSNEWKIGRESSSTKFPIKRTFPSQPIPLYGFPKKPQNNFNCPLKNNIFYENNDTRDLNGRLSAKHNISMEAAIKP
jgi:hypothetical protein